MITDRWEKLQAIFTAALQRPPGERLAFTREACGDDEALQAEVESLLRSYDDESSFLQEPVKGANAVCRVLRDLDPLAPEPESQGEGSGRAIDDVARSGAPLPLTIGRYRITRLVGEGGMGLVYEAEQAQPRRVVALKVIKAGWTDPQVVRRFRHESQALARLQHPGIAQIYEAGEDNSGETGSQLFFAMEFIHGEQLVKYADGHHLTTRERLELMAKVCDAVEHAHERGLIHRDLKPGNILVNEAGQPKILDFGVARVTGSDVEATRHTEMGQLLGTVAYMSPEQVLGDPLAVDKRSDVYAIGVILYELLADRLPYRISPQIHEALRAVKEDDPEPLSSIQRSYRGDIETIVAKALEKDKARRYASVADLAADIRHYLQNEPIAARPPSSIYKLEKFARRHRAVVAGVSAVFLVLLAGVIVSTRQAVRARRAERAAVSEAAKAKTVSDFLQNDILAQASVVRQAGPGSAPDPNMTVRTALNRAAAHIGERFGKQPELEAQIRSTLGETYAELGLFAEARTQVERALQLDRQILGPDHRETLKMMRFLSNVASLQGKFDEAESLLNQILSSSRPTLHREDADTLTAMAALGGVYFHEGKYPQAEAAIGQALQLQRRLLGPENPGTVVSMNNLASTYLEEGKDQEAEKMYSQVLEIHRRVLGPEHPDTLEAAMSLAMVYSAQGRNTLAEPIIRHVLETQRRNLGPEHPGTFLAANNLSMVEIRLGEFSQAEPLIRQTMNAEIRVLGEQDDHTLNTMANLADLNTYQGKYAVAEGLYRRTLDISRRTLGPEHPDTLSFEEELTSMYQREGRYAKAEAQAAEVLAGRQHALGPESTDTLQSANDLALAFLSEGKFGHAESLARGVIDHKREPDDWELLRAKSMLGGSLAGQKRFGEAEPLLLETYQAMLAQKRLMGAPNFYHLNLTSQWIAQLYQDWGKPEKAAEWKKAHAAA